MLSVFLIARLFYRDRAALNATGFAALVVLVWSPTALFEAGFQLTFLALFAITGISVPLLERTSNRYRAALAHFDSTAFDLNIDPRIAQLRLDMRLVIERLARFSGNVIARWLVLGAVRTSLAAFELLLVSTITQAVLVAPMRCYFHRATLIGMPANILVLPLAGVMLNCRRAGHRAQLSLYALGSRCRPDRLCMFALVAGLPRLAGAFPGRTMAHS